MTTREHWRFTQLRISSFPCWEWCKSWTPKLPVANEYLLLSGGVREGVVDLDLDELNVYARGTDYDMDFTLLVPALKLHDRNQPVTLDMRHSALCLG